MENIVLIGLIYDENLGDQAIAFSTKQMVKNSLRRNQLSWKIRFLDIYGRTSVSKSNKLGLKTKMIDIVKKIVPQKVLHTIAEKKLFSTYLNEANMSIDSETKAIIFVGGGLIKYKKQMLCRPISATIDLAEKYNIPVMLSAIGVEGYDETNAECVMLKKSLNSSVVRCITTRDDIVLLSKDYVFNKAIRIKKVFDPACSLCEYIKPEIRINSKPVIGLGIARSGLFFDYGLDVSEEYLTNLWVSIIQRLKNYGYDVRLFTNGHKDDYSYALRISNIVGNQVLIEKRPTTLKKLVNIICGYNGIIATRMHSCILAYSYNIPACGLVWNNKLKMFGESINREKYYYEVDDLKADTIVEGLLDYMLIGNEQKKHSSTEREISLFIDSVMKQNN